MHRLRQVWPSDDLFLVPGIRNMMIRKQGLTALFCFPHLEMTTTR